EPMHRTLQRALAPGRAAVGDVIRAALVLVVDHELNVSAFAARCAASAGASPYDVVSAAMAALEGDRDGDAGERVLGVARAADTLGSARLALANRLRRGEAMPGFGHPLYPSGDPRAVLLIQFAERSGSQSEYRRFRNLQRAGLDLLNDEPNLDFGLAA